MLFIKTPPAGIDVPIQKFQQQLHNDLLEIWAIDTSLYSCYGRCYRNKKDNKYIAENYEGNNEYKEAYWDDTKAIVSFFGLSNTEKHDIGETTLVHLVFFVDLSKLKPTLTHRADEEVRRDVQILADQGGYGFKYVSTDQWLENCLKEYNGSAKKLESKVDMHPVHCFRINFELNYNKNICP